jgi:transcriptional regulator with XRE-family HTH domain
MGRKSIAMWQSELKELKINLSENVRVLRGSQGLSQEQLAFEASVDRTLVSKIERTIANPTLEVLTKLAVVLGVPVARLLKP